MPFRPEPKFGEGIREAHISFEKYNVMAISQQPLPSVGWAL